LSYGSETWTINKRDTHKGRRAIEIFKTPTETDNNGPPNEIEHPKQTENRKSGRGYEKIREKLVRSTERKGDESSTQTGFPMTAQGTTERRMT
jgi:hypothetical protein